MKSLGGTYYPTIHGGANRVLDLRSRRRVKRRTFPGYGWVGNLKYYDSTIALPPHQWGTAIVDESSGAKTWIRVRLSAADASKVTYQTIGPSAGVTSWSDHWFYFDDQIVPFFVPLT